MWRQQGCIGDKALAGDQNPEHPSLEDKGSGFCLWGQKSWSIRMQGWGGKDEGGREGGGRSRGEEREVGRRGGIRLPSSPGPWVPLQGLGSWSWAVCSSCQLACLHPLRQTIPVLCTPASFKPGYLLQRCTGLLALAGTGNQGSTFF